jgi:hypothetical protein
MVLNHTNADPNLPVVALLPRHRSTGCSYQARALQNRSGHHPSNRHAGIRLPPNHHILSRPHLQVPAGVHAVEYWRCLVLSRVRDEPVSRQNSIPAENGAFLPAPQREESELDQELR